MRKQIRIYEILNVVRLIFRFKKLIFNNSFSSINSWQTELNYNYCYVFVNVCYFYVLLMMGKGKQAARCENT